MKRAIIVQARMTSTRLPGKILKPVLGKPLLQYQLERLQQVQNKDVLIVATTTNEDDDPVVDLCRTLSVECYRGGEHDVLGRYYEAARQYQADAIVRVTGDCPLIDPHVVDVIIEAYLEAAPAVDYVSNTLERTFPRGLDVEVFSFAALETAYRNAIDLSDREHVTPYIYRHPKQFRLGQYQQPENRQHLRWTVDTIEDFMLIEKILTALYPQNPRFTQRDVLDLLAQHPDWSLINAHVEQAKL